MKIKVQMGKDGLVAVYEPPCYNARELWEQYIDDWV